MWIYVSKGIKCLRLTQHLVKTSIHQVIDKIDKDGDGTVSVKEAVNAMRGSWKEW